MTVTSGPRGSSVVRDWNVAEEDYLDLLNQSFTNELNTQRETEEEEEEEEGQRGARVDGKTLPGN